MSPGVWCRFYRRQLKMPSGCNSLRLMKKAPVPYQREPLPAAMMCPTVDETRNSASGSLSLP